MQKKLWSSDNKTKAAYVNWKERYMADWQQILDDNAHSLWQVIYQLLSNQNEASECFKEAFISTYEDSKHHPVSTSNIYPTIAKAAISKVIDKLHQRFQNKSVGQDVSDMVIIPSNGPKPLTTIKSQELAGRLRKTLSQVPAQKAQLFCLSKFIGLSNKQIAKAYGLNKHTVTVFIDQTEEKLSCLLELRNEQRISSGNILDEAIAAIKQESVSTQPPSKTLHEITKILPAQLSEAMQKKGRVVRRIKALNWFRIIAAIVVLAGAIIIAIIFTFIQQKQIEKINRNSDLFVDKPAEPKPGTKKAENIDRVGESAEIEFTRVMESFNAGDANGITRLFQGDSLLNKIVLAKFLGEMGDEKSIPTLNLFYNETKDMLRGKIEPNPFLEAIEKIQTRLGYELAEVNEPAKAEDSAPVQEAQETAEPEKQPGLTGDVISIQGQTVANAYVIVSDTTNPAFVFNGQIEGNSGLETTTTDSQGRFAFADIKNDSLITVIHEVGFSEMTKQTLQQDPTVVLTSWGYVTGQLLIENAPAPNQAIELTYPASGNNKIIYSHSTTTDSQGYFAFENVKPENVKITHVFELPKPTGYDSDKPLLGNGGFKIININSEKEAKVIIGENCFTITGQLGLSADSGITPDWAHSIAMVIGSDKANPYSVLVNDDGSFWGESLPAGSYDFSVMLYTNEDGSYFQKSIAEFKAGFNLPPADPNETTLDLGTFELNPTQE